MVDWNMGDWNNFYLLIGGTAGTLIGLIFVVYSLGVERAQAGDSDRTRLFVTPILAHLGSLLLIALALVAPISALTRALAVGVIGCLGLAYVANLALISRKQIDPAERDILWDTVLPIAAYACLTAAAMAWALTAPFAYALAAIATVLLLVIAVRNSWMITLAIASRPRK